MADIADMAQSREEAHRQRAIDAALKVMHGKTQQTRDGRVICEDCGEFIPARRLRAIPRATRCVACQAEMEGD